MESKLQLNDPLLVRYQALLAISEAISAHRELQSLFSDLTRQLRPIVDFDGIATLLYDPVRDRMHVHLMETQIRDEAAIPTEMRVDDAPGGWVWKNQQPMIISDTATETRFKEALSKAYQSGIRSICVLPLTTASRRLGSLAFGSAKPDNYSEVDLEFLQQVARQTALAIDNALNFESARSAEQEAKRRLEQLRLLLEVNNNIAAHLDLRELFKAISSNLRQVINCDFAALTVYDPEINMLRLHALQAWMPRENLVEEGTPLPIQDSPNGLCFTSRKTVLVRHPAELEKFTAPNVRRVVADGMKSGCSAPLISRGRVLGTLDVVSRLECAFTEEDAELIAQIAGQIAIAVENAMAYREIESLKNKLADEKLYLEEEISAAYNFEEIIGGSSALKRILKQVETVAPIDSTVLIYGETGTGKELIARAIHNLSSRRERTLVKINCAAIPTGLLESELFGHEKGAFTGAVAQRIGRFELANKGTLFLDEIGEIALDLQPKLLRVLQEQEFERLGGSRTMRVDVRLIAATNRNLEQMVAEGRFREDLYYRLKVFPVLIPPLRERREDIPMLVRFFAGKFARRMNKKIETISAETIAELQQYHWPGNIRELENLIERAAILTQGTELKIPSGEIKPQTKPDAAKPSASVPSPKSHTLNSVERDHIVRILEETDWVVGGPEGAAARLGMKRTTLQARMRKLGIARQI